MPSGAKKRKAAKKKKEQASRQINTSTKSTHGNDDPRSHDEKESDGSISSPASHDNEDNHPFKTCKESLKEVPGFGSEEKIEIEKELKPEENIEITDSRPGQDKSSSSSSSSSDDESREIEKRDDKEAGDSAAEVIADSLSKDSKQAMSAAANALFPGPSANVIVENTAPVESTMPTKPNSEKQIQMENISEKASVISAVDIVVSNEDDEKSLPDVNKNAAKGVSASDENTQATLGATDSDVNEDKALPVSDPIPQTNGVPEGVIESEVPMSHEKEAPVRPPLAIARRTSCLSCCGLFDVITGSRI